MVSGLGNIIFVENEKQMNTSDIAARIVALRKGKGLSQEKLAERASINLRTLQRLEKGETEPRGDTLRLIASALEVPVERLIAGPAATSGIAGGNDHLPTGGTGAEPAGSAHSAEKEDKGFLQFMNLSALAFWFVPLGNIALPMLLWHMKKDQVKGARRLGRRIINFQLTWSGVFLVSVVMLIVSKILHFTVPFSLTVLGLTILSFYVLNTLAVLLASFQLIRGRESIFSLSLRILR